MIQPTLARLKAGALERIPDSLRAAFERVETHQALAGWGTGTALVVLLLLIHSAWLPNGSSHPAAYLPACGVAIAVAAVVNLYTVYLKLFEPQLVREARRLYVLALVTVLGFTSVWVLQLLKAPAYLSPLPCVGILLAVFLNSRVALFTAFLMALTAGASLGAGAPSALEGAGAILVQVGGAIAAIFAVHRIRARMDLARAGLFASLVNVVLIGALAALSGGSPMLWGQKAMWGAIGGVGSAVLAVGILPYFEALFGIMTPFKLLELANPTQPLLRHVLTKAPGTYHHSIMVGNLAEAAAEAIGADALLVRVGAYYHDIGKTKRPIFFIENQLGIDNAHDKLHPRLSARVIIAHVEEGMELARQHRLPQDISDFIATHHGKSLVSYFMHQAEQLEGPEAVSEEGFRYPGPRPWTKEQGIVMLADVIEATMRTLKSPSVEQIEATVRRIVNKRLQEGELSETPLTMAELEVCAQVFIRITQGLYHQRIEYPDQLLNDLNTKRPPEGKKVGSPAR
jgi:hypothetical protein